MIIRYKKYTMENDKNIDTKIIHISDIHISKKYKTKRLNVIKEKIKTIKPNYICITGDIVDTHDAIYDQNFLDLEKFIKELSQIGKVIISIGNHEYVKKEKKGYKKIEDIEWLKKFKTDKIIVLDNEIYEEKNISFIGYNPDYEYYYTYKEKQPEKYNKKIEELIDKTTKKYKILLIHTPIIILRKNNYKKIKNIKKLALILSGHTHGGMIPSFIPGHFGIISPTRELFPKNIRGTKTLDKTKIIINSGIIKLSRKSKITFLNDIYSSDIIEIDIKPKIINKKY